MRDRAKHSSRAALSTRHSGRSRPRNAATGPSLAIQKQKRANNERRPNRVRKKSRPKQREKKAKSREKGKSRSDKYKVSKRTSVEKRQRSRRRRKREDKGESKTRTVDSAKDPLYNKVKSALQNLALEGQGPEKSPLINNLDVKTVPKVPTKVFIGNLGSNAKVDDLTRFFSRLTDGAVSLVLEKDHAVAEFSSSSDAQKVLALHGGEYKGRELWLSQYLDAVLSQQQDALETQLDDPTMQSMDETNSRPLSGYIPDEEVVSRHDGFDHEKSGGSSPSSKSVTQLKDKIAKLEHTLHEKDCEIRRLKTSLDRFEGQRPPDIDSGLADPSRPSRSARRERSRSRSGRRDRSHPARRDSGREKDHRSRSRRKRRTTTRLQEFIAKNNLDDACARTLNSLTEDDQNAVMDDGFLVDDTRGPKKDGDKGRSTNKGNRSAIVVGRVNRLMKQRRTSREKRK